MAIADRVRSLVESSRLPVVAAVLALVLTAPSLSGGLSTEDWIQKAVVVRGEHAVPFAANLFGHTVRVSPTELLQRNRLFRAWGFFPWLTSEDFDASFFRPLASLTHRLDYRLWPEHPGLMHLESIAWYAALAAAVALLYRRLARPPWLAGAAALLYAIDDAHGHAVGWLINRNALLAAFFGVVALIEWDRFRSGRVRAAAATSAAALSLSLASSEFGLCIAGYFAAHALVLDRGARASRARAAMIWIGVVLAWAVLYRGLGHASRGSGIYVDPLVDPVEYGFEFFERGAVLLMGQFGAPFSDLWTHGSAYAQGLLVVWAFAFVWLVFAVLWPLFREDASARFWGLGMVLSLPPACATFTEDRLLFFAGVGAMPLVVQTVARAWSPATAPASGESRLRRASTRGLAAVFVVLHGLAAPILLPYRSLAMARYEGRLARARETAYAGTTGAVLTVLVNGEDFYFTSMLPQTRAALGEPATERLLTLAGTDDAVVISRIDDRTLRVTPTHGFLSRTFDRIYRSRRDRMKRGERLDLVGIDVQVKEVNASGEPLSATFRFTGPLEAPAYRFRVWNRSEGRYVPFEPPHVGAEVRVGGA